MHVGPHCCGLGRARVSAWRRHTECACDRIRTALRMCTRRGENRRTETHPGGTRTGVRTCMGGAHKTHTESTTAVTAAVQGTHTKCVWAGTKIVHEKRIGAVHWRYTGVHGGRTQKVHGTTRPAHTDGTFWGHSRGTRNVHFRASARRARCTNACTATAKRRHTKRQRRCHEECAANAQFVAPFRCASSDRFWRV